ncbi:choice-of-anchor Q domain-containing protein [Arsenicibacter rosenii]|uniref:Ig-like domain-containing protein n=1 Tax=Arsenicibacter rosenii TaxID=1750698 RepID=A0A1S2VNU3_9BACT|nr:choice-of-anchor Q domain-containing protein [Arsenicibacter rosenii]OIN60447.1 hypothetical protein BLX24_06400 [Arsenicibacter rosenii]
MNTSIRILATGLLCCLLSTNWAFGQITRYVSTTGITPATSATTSWATSTTDLQGAINASQPGDQVWVAAGVYKPTSITNNQGASFAMKNGVAIYGGFKGNETLLSQRPPINPIANNPSSSTLSGDIDNDGTLANNSYHVIFNPASLSLTNTAVLDGFVITGGNASGTSPNNFGGGVYNTGFGSGQVCSPGFRNCSLVGNSASSQGGGMFNDGRSNGRSNPVLTNCRLQDNIATGQFGQGGAMYNNGTDGLSSPVLTNCLLQANSAGQGGAMYNYAYNGQSNPVLTNCRLQDNTATGQYGLGGAMYNYGYNGGVSSPVLTNCTLQGNTASSAGGAMFNNGSSNGQSNPVLTNCVLWNNGGSNSFFNNTAVGASATYSLFDNTVTDYGGSNNLTTTTSPFVSATSAALLPCSPAINAGAPNTTTATVGTTDLAGNPRFIGSRIDMGAVEYQSTTLPTRLYVAASQTANAGDGLSWATAFSDLQSALTYPCNQSLTEIWVAQGIYKPTSTTARDISFSMLPNVAIYGGFLGTETNLGQRPAPITGNPSGSTLSGDIGTVGNAGDNSYHVIYNPASLSLTNSAVLDGFVITGGNANGAGSPNNEGGGIRNNGNGVFRNCLLQGNSASSAGGAIFNVVSSPILTNCLLQGNSANFGGAMFNYGTDGVASPGLTNCLLQGNSANFGGAMFNYGTNGIANPGLTNCLLQGNSALLQGGAMYNQGAGGIASPVLTNCSLQSNSAQTGGAMISNGNNGISNPVLTGCVLWNNGGSNSLSNDLATTRLRYSLFEPESVTAGVDITGPGNLTTTISPFVSATSVALAACSPAINAGNPASATAASGPYSATVLPATDLTGNARITGTRIDIGAVEYQNPNGVPLQIVQQPVAGSVICAGTTVVVSVSVAGSSPAYQWYRSGIALTGIASASTASLTLTNVQSSDAGSYPVVISGDCPSVTSTAFSLSVNALPSVTVTAAPSATLSCTNPSLTLTAQTSATAFVWSSGGCTGQTLPVSQTGVYSVTVTDGNRCTAVSNSPTIERDDTSPIVSISALSTTLTCTQPQLTLTATSSATALRWSTGQTTATVSVSQTGTYSVTATGANGCSAVSNNLTIGQDFSLPPFTVSSATVCPGQSVNLTASGCGGQVRWSTGASAAMITLTAGSSTSTLTATCIVGSCSATASGQVVVGGIQPPPAQLLSFTADESACPVRLVGRGVASSFTMSGPGGYVFSTVYREGSIHDAIGLNVKQAGSYTLTAVYTNSCGSSAPVSRTVTVGRSCP